ncbi:hypothetical protein HPB48_007583 [Haemaphysalis longicornis]|uniref:P-type domain-containing protein n=1 Tax=Haemaphysalis longicornis TaxID=44386 RepID=A0A9J6FQE8_HAELO|nr:hypothetical protein HPB48_007583 [Haemaphysalis longicornis]
MRSHNPRVVRTSGSSSFHSRVSLSAACNVDVAGRFDCHPEPGINRVRCERRGCCFRNDSGQGGTTPTCYFPTGFSGYKVKAHVVAASASGESFASPTMAAATITSEGLAVGRIRACPCFSVFQWGVNSSRS